MRKYHFLSFRAGVDWRNVNPVLLQRLNRLGADRGITIDIVSGARTVQGNTGASRSHHVPQYNPSGMGEAVDAYVSGVALANQFNEKTLRRYGLYSGNRPGFYKGAPDPEHIETIERRTGKGVTPTQGTTPRGASANSDAPVEAPPQGPLPNDMPIEQDLGTGPPPPGSPPIGGPPIEGFPGDIPPDQFQELDPAQQWQTLADMPFSSPETQMWAARIRRGIT